jgi:ABC-2 type transport system permease protein
MHSSVQSIGWHIRLIPNFVAQFLKARMSYRFDFFVSMGTALLTTLLGLSFIMIVFQRIPSIGDWSFEEMLFIYGFALVPTAIFSSVSVNLWEFGSHFIIEGNFDRVLLRPISSLFQIYFEAFRMESLGEVLIGIYLMSYAGGKLELALGWGDYGVMMVLILSAVVILLAFFTLLTSINFWVEDRLGIAAPIFNMIPLGRYPTTLYSKTIRTILATLIPFAYVGFFPATYFLGRPEFRKLALATPLVALVLAIITVAVWHRGVRRYSSVGH